MRALLDLMRDNESRVQKSLAVSANILKYARRHLTILDPEVGKEELIQAVAATLAKLRC